MLGKRSKGGTGVVPAKKKWQNDILEDSDLSEDYEQIIAK
jgi:hypothetical protein